MNNKIKQAELTLIIGMGIVFSGNALADNASTYATKTGLNQEITDRKAADTTEIGLRKTADDALKLSITNIPAGPQGVKGDAGAAGAAGAQGIPGQDGAAGAKGDAGAAGAAGAAGSQGIPGQDGAAGGKGDAGAAGAAGAAGSQGIPGQDGAAGGKGDAGAAGAAGAAGPQGSVGETGPAGITNTFTYSMTCGTHTPQNEACKVGTVGPGGGWIFFVDYNEQYSGFNYLEAAPTDIAVVIWCTDTSTSIPAVAGWSANAIGAGQRNTTAIIGAGCTTGAAQSADSYYTGTESDWFLGSEGEMMLMYTNLRQAGVGGFANSNYWSSSENNSSNAWYQYFSNGSQNYGNKTNALPVRAVRAF